MKFITLKSFFASISFLSFLGMCTCCSHSPLKSENGILKKLANAKGKGILFGHQDDLAYGIGWNGIDGESDVKRVTGDYPALFGWELGGLELNHDRNLDSVPFETIKKLAIKAHQMGGINTFSWHPFSPNKGFSAWAKDSVVVKNIIQGGIYHQEFLEQLDKVAEFFKGLKDNDGTPIPFIFRPWHEMDGTWFWWGSQACTATQFKELFRETVNYLRHEKGLSLMVVAYSPDKAFNSRESYLTWYAGDDVVDILGADNYFDFTKPNGLAEVVQKLHIVIETAKEKNKLAAFTETGCTNVTDSTWFTRKLGVILNDSLIKKEVSYVMVWRNASTHHFFFPYPNHNAASNALEFTNDSTILLLNKFNKLKQD